MADKWPIYPNQVQQALNKVDPMIKEDLESCGKDEDDWKVVEAYNRIHDWQ